MARLYSSGNVWPQRRQQLGSIRTSVVQHPRVVRRLLPGCRAASARPRRMLPCRRAASASVAGQHPPCRGGCWAAAGQQPPGRLAAAAAGRRQPPRLLPSKAYLPLPKFLGFRCRRVAGLTRRLLIAFFMTEALGSRPAPGTPSGKRSVGTRRAASMWDTLSEGTARAAQLAPSAVTAGAVGGSATRGVVGRVSSTKGGSSNACTRDRTAGRTFAVFPHGCRERRIGCRHRGCRHRPSFGDQKAPLRR